MDEIIKNRDVQSLLEYINRDNVESVLSVLDDKFIKRAFVFSAINGCVSIMLLLIENGVDINGVTSYGSTALVSSAVHGQLESVSFLLNNGADVNLGSIYHISPLCASIDTGCILVVKNLIENGADVSANNNYPIRKSLKIHNPEFIGSFLCYLSMEQLKIIIENEELKKELLKYIMKKGLFECEKIINLLRTVSIDVYDLFDKELC